MNHIEQTLHKAYRNGELSGDDVSLVMACLLMCKKHLDAKQREIFKVQYGSISADLLWNCE